MTKSKHRHKYEYIFDGIYQYGLFGWTYGDYKYKCICGRIKLEIKEKEDQLSKLLEVRA